MLLKVLIWRNFESVAHDLLAIFVERECPGPSEGPSEAAGRSMLKKSAAALFVISGVSVGAAPAYAIPDVALEQYAFVIDGVLVWTPPGRQGPIWV